MKDNQIYLSEVIDQKNNSFGFIRFFLATLVIFSHCYSLGGFGNEFILENHPVGTYGAFAVDCFFVISGFLITGSYTKCDSFWRFLWHRCLRIFPGFWVCLLVIALVFGPIAYLTERSTLDGYFNLNTQDNYLYFIKSNFFLELKQLNVANLFSKNPYPKVFNGSLWTLIYEFKCYIAVALLGILGFLNKSSRVVYSVFLFLWFTNCLNHAIPGTSAKLIPFLSDTMLLKSALYFFSGSAYFLYSREIAVNNKLFCISLTLLILSFRDNFYVVISPIVLPYLLFWLAYKLPLKKVDKYGDFSYGLYIYAFAVQQMLSLYGINRLGFFVYFILAFFLSFILAVISYFVIEKPCLKLKKIEPWNLIQNFKINLIWNKWQK